MTTHALLSCLCPLKQCGSKTIVMLTTLIKVKCILNIYFEWPYMYILILYGKIFNLTVNCKAFSVTYHHAYTPALRWFNSFLICMGFRTSVRSCSWRSCRSSTQSRSIYLLLFQSNLLITGEVTSEVIVQPHPYLQDLVQIVELRLT